MCPIYATHPLHGAAFYCLETIMPMVQHDIISMLQLRKSEFTFPRNIFISMIPLNVMTL